MSKRTELAQVVAEQTLQQKNLKQLARQIAAYLLEHGRVNELESLMRDVMAYREAKGIVEAEVVSAHELSEASLKDVHTLLKTTHPKAKQVIAHNSVDESVIGGLKVQLAHEQLDMTLRAKLDTFKRLTTEGMK